MVLAAVGTSAIAQNPDVLIHVDMVPTYRLQTHRQNFQWYDTMGHYSTVSLGLSLEPGFKAYVSERLQRVNNDADPEQLDEYYVEDPGIWRVGKQYLPFGRQGLLRDAARAARGDTRLLLPTIPITVAICDNGARQVRGIVGRVGSSIGLSFAYGNNFGAQASSFDVVRRPEDAPGRGRGYGTAVGIDFARHYKIYTLQAEAVALRRGETSLDRDTEISDVALTLQPDKYKAVTLAWSREWRGDDTFWRVQGKFLVTRAVWLEPIVRIKDGEFFDLGLTLRVRL